MLSHHVKSYGCVLRHADRHWHGYTTHTTDIPNNSVCVLCYANYLKSRILHPSLKIRNPLSNQNHRVRTKEIFCGMTYGLSECTQKVSRRTSEPRMYENTHVSQCSFQGIVAKKRKISDNSSPLTPSGILI